MAKDRQTIPIKSSRYRMIKILKESAFADSFFTKRPRYVYFIEILPFNPDQKTNLIHPRDYRYFLLPPLHQKHLIRKQIQ